MKIRISENGILAGTGDLEYTPEKGGQYFVTNCPAELGSNSGESEAAYRAIDDAINDGRDCADTIDNLYTWEIIDE